MKRIKFLNGIGTIYAFAVIALTGFLFTSCEKEDLKATFEPGPAEITFNVKVVDTMDGDVTSSATITGADKISKNASIPAGTVTITAAYKGANGSQTVAYDALTIGGKRTINVTVMISSGYTITAGDPTVLTTIYTLGDATHSHNGENWALNDNDYILVRDITYKVFNKQVATTDVSKVDLSTFINALNYGDKSTTGVLSLKVSAWAYYRAWTTKLTTTTKYTITRKGNNEVLGTVVVVSDSSTSAEYQETASDNSHYHYGHGHGHGTGNNAGGGIVYAD